MLSRCVLLILMSVALPLQAAGVAVGDVAPEVTLPRMPDTGEELSLESLRGKVVYLDFWASWCGPCRISFPQLEDLRLELGAQGFEVFAVNVDEVEDAALDFLTELPVSYPIVWDPSGASSASYGVLGMPTGYLIDRQGVVRDIHQGYTEGDGEKLRAAIENLLAE
ncbi:MAG: TlpA disulfide reductase family protein [Pseudomonadota bacterium]